MYLDIKSILEQINSTWITYKCIGNEDQAIHGVKLFDEMQTATDAHFIYIASFNTLNKMHIKQLPANIFIISEDSNPIIPDELLTYTTSKHNLIVFHSEISLSHLINHISELLADNYELIKRPASLFNTIIKGRGLSYILQIAGELLENPVLLGDNNHRLLAASDFGEIDDPSWMEFRNIGYSTYEYTQKYGYEKWIAAAVKAKKPIIGDLGINGKYRRIFATVQNNQRVIGHIAVLEYNRPFTDKDLEVTEFICNVLASEMRSYYSEKISGLVAGRLMLDLIQGIDLSSAQVDNRIKDMNINLPKMMQLIAIKFNNYSDTFSLISFICEPRNNIKLTTDVVVYKNHLLFITPEPDETQTRNNLKKLAEILEKTKIRCGISQSFSDIKHISKFYLQSTKAIIIGEKLNREKHMFYYEDFALMDLIYELNKSVDVNNYVHPSLIRLKAYDQRHKTDYLNSLYTYIINLGNIASSADALFIHRNTMNYRMGKIQEIIAIDLNDQDQLINLFFSYKLLEYKDLL